MRHELRTFGKHFVLAALSLGLLGGSARALDQEPIQPSTELGVTVTPDDIFNSLEETLSFWPAVRRHITSGELKGTETAHCLEADACIGVVQDQLHDRLMGADQQEAMDVIHYLTWNIRRTHFFRELRQTVGDKHAVRLRAAVYAPIWEAEDTATPDRAVLTSAAEPALKELGLAIDKEARARELLESIATCLVAMEATEAGRLIRSAEFALTGQPCAETARRIVSAADWASVIKETDTPTRREHFIAAWEELHGPAVALTASAR